MTLTDNEKTDVFMKQLNDTTEVIGQESEKIARVTDLVYGDSNITDEMRNRLDEIAHLFTQLSDRMTEFGVYFDPKSQPPQE